MSTYSRHHTAVQPISTAWEEPYMDCPAWEELYMDCPEMFDSTRRIENWLSCRVGEGRNHKTAPFQGILGVTLGQDASPRAQTGQKHLFEHPKWSRNNFGKKSKIFFAPRTSLGPPWRPMLPSGSTKGALVWVSRRLVG